MKKLTMKDILFIRESLQSLDHEKECLEIKAMVKKAKRDQCEILKMKDSIYNTTNLLQKNN